MLAKLALLSMAALAANSTSVATIDATGDATEAGLDAEVDPGWPTPPSFAELARAQVAPEVLQGFEDLVVTQINALFGSESLPLATGANVQPGIYVTVSPQQALIFDEKILDLESGVIPPGPASRECKSGCKAAVWSPFRRAWLEALEEAQTYALELPSRVLFGAEASVPAATLVELAYAAAETRPGQPPAFSLLVNGNNAGLRARPFFLIPPGGMRVAPGENALALRVKLGAAEAWTLSAAHPRFQSQQGTGWKQLFASLAGVAKTYPNKSTIIIDVGDDATVGDVVNAMIAAQKQFPTVVLTDGFPVKWG